MSFRRPSYHQATTKAAEPPVNIITEESQEENNTTDKEMEGNETNIGGDEVKLLSPLENSISAVITTHNHSLSNGSPRMPSKSRGGSIMNSQENVDKSAKIDLNVGGMVYRVRRKNFDNFPKTRLSFVTAHLAAHEGDSYYKMRCENIRSILREAKTFDLQSPAKLDVTLSSHHSFFLGDLNFRTRFDNGKSRTRLPVALKMALHNAGANDGTPVSPTPAGAAVLGTTSTKISFGESLIRATLNPS